MKVYLEFENQKVKGLFLELFSQCGIHVSKEKEEVGLVLSKVDDLTIEIKGHTSHLLTLPFYFFDLLDLMQKAVQQPKIKFSSYTLSIRDKLLIDESTGLQQRLTEKEIQLLCYLHDFLDHEVAREDILKNVWDYSDKVETHTLETHIYRLRQKLETDPSTPKIIMNTRLGYCLKSF